MYYLYGIFGCDCCIANRGNVRENEHNYANFVKKGINIGMFLITACDRINCLISLLNSLNFCIDDRNFKLNKKKVLYQLFCEYFRRGGKEIKI